MQTQGTPDLLTSGQLTRRTGQVNRDLALASQELTTGEQADLVAASAGDPRRIYAIDRDLTALDARKTVIDLAIGRAEVSQNALGRVEDASKAIGADLKAAVERGLINDSEFEASVARDTFEEVVSALNTRFGDRTLFAGADVGGAALASADDILAEIATRVAGAADSAAVVAAVDDYFFTDPTGFETSGYLGSTQDAPGARIADGEELDYAIRADANELREVMASLAIAVVGAEGGFAGATDPVRLNVLGAAADRMIEATDDVIRLRAGLGVFEERFDSASVEVDSERLFLAEARNRIVAKDPFEAATEFTAIETQLQTILAITARLSSLNLTNFLR